MSDYDINVGTDGILEIRDHTTMPGRYVELWVQTPVLAANNIVIPWWTVIDGVQSNIQSYILYRTTNKVRVSRIIPPANSVIFTWHIENTGSAELDGPVDFTITLQMGMAQAKAFVKVGNEWKKAIPFVRDGGIWKVASPEVMINSEWKEAT